MDFSTHHSHHLFKLEEILKYEFWSKRRWMCCWVHFIGHCVRFSLHQSSTYWCVLVKLAGRSFFFERKSGCFGCSTWYHPWDSALSLHYFDSSRLCFHRAVNRQWESFRFRFLRWTLHLGSYLSSRDYTYLPDTLWESSTYFPRSLSLVTICQTGLSYVRSFSA